VGELGEEHRGRAGGVVISPSAAGTRSAAAGSEKIRAHRRVVADALHLEGRQADCPSGTVCDVVIDPVVGHSEGAKVCFTPGLQFP
jgi:hypothetical protein